jgi:hypothetical protein
VWREPVAECTRRSFADGLRDPPLSRPPERSSAGVQSARTLSAMPLGLDYGLIAALCWGSTDVMGTIGGRRLGSLPVIAIAQASSLAVAALVALAMGVRLPSDPLVLLLAGLVGVVAAGAR